MPQSWGQRGLGRQVSLLSSPVLETCSVGHLSSHLRPYPPAHRLRLLSMLEVLRCWSLGLWEPASSYLARKVLLPWRWEVGIMTPPSPPSSPQLPRRCPLPPILRGFSVTDGLGEQLSKMLTISPVMLMPPYLSLLDLPCHFISLEN